MKKTKETRIIDHVSKETLDEIVDRLVAKLDPIRIVLFGSYAYGDPHEESDIDIIIVKESNLPRYKRAVPAYEALAGLVIPKDILVYTPEEIEEWSEVPQAFIYRVMNQGKVIYEKE